MHGSCLRKSYLEIGKGVKTARNSLLFSHLFFANDLILFAKATQKKKKNCSTIKKVVDTFCRLSGQKINLAKSKIFFSPHASPSNMESMENELSISSSRNFGKYLGVPILKVKETKEHTISSSTSYVTKCHLEKPKPSPLRVASHSSTLSHLPSPHTSCKTPFASTNL